MKKSCLLLFILLSFLIFTSCSLQDVVRDISTGQIASSEYSMISVSTGNASIKVETPMTLSNNDMLSYTQKNEFLRIRMIGGRYYEDWNPGAYMGTNWEGQFIIELADESGVTIAQTYLSNIYREPLLFNSPFNLEFDDYNNDGDVDFTLGQYASSNGRLFKIFTLRKDGKVEQLLVRDHPELFISNSTGYYSTKLNKTNGTTFEIEYYNNAEASTYHDSYQWADGHFVFVNSQKMDE